MWSLPFVQRITMEEDVGEKIHERSEYAYPNGILRMETRDGRDWAASKLSYCNIKRVWWMGRRWLRSG